MCRVMAFVNHVKTKSQGWVYNNGRKRNSKTDKARPSCSKSNDRGESMNRKNKIISEIEDTCVNACLLLDAMCTEYKRLIAAMEVRI